MISTRTRVRRTWLLFSAGTVAVLAALGWVSSALVQLEDAQIESRIASDFQADLRLALWRMDAWFAPRLAGEAARPVEQYRAFYRRPADAGDADDIDLVTASPLLSADSDVFALHFEVRANPDPTSTSALLVTSPQVPIGEDRVLALMSLVEESVLVQRESLLAQLESSFVANDAFVWDTVDPATVFQKQQAELENIVADRMQQMAESEPQVFNSYTDETMRKSMNRSLAEQSKRDIELNACNINEQIEAPVAMSQQWIAGNGELLPLPQQEQMQVGPLLPLWIDQPYDIQQIAHASDRAKPLQCCRLLVRRIEANNETFYQGVLIDWDALKRALTEQVDDLFEHVSITNASDVEDRSTIDGRIMATLPLAVSVSGQRTPLITADATAMYSPARSVVLLAWLAAIGAIATVGLTLRASLTHGERRTRFASAVTHELRTPLTTFRMYAEMLADGMVRDPEKRTEYLETLKSESGRLARLVENVLSYARLENTGTPDATSTISVESLIQNAEPDLQRRVADAGMTLNIDVDAIGDTVVVADRQTTEQILFNLVENACKYAGEGSVDLTATRQGTRVEIRVRDHGPGVPANQRKTIFTPFERGTRHLDDPTPGIGLGLALARGLARRLHGDLRCESPVSGPGAVFCLTLPCRSGH